MTLGINHQKGIRIRIMKRRRTRINHFLSMMFPWRENMELLIMDYNWIMG